MKPINFSAERTAEPLPSAGEMLHIPGSLQSRRVLEVWIRYMYCDFSRPAHAMGKERLFYHGLTNFQRTWLVRDGFGQFVHTDINSQFCIDSLFTVYQSQILYRRNLLGMRLIGTAIPGNLRWCCSRLSPESLERNSRQRTKQSARAKSN